MFGLCLCDGTSCGGRLGMLETKPCCVAMFTLHNAMHLKVAPAVGGHHLLSRPGTMHGMVFSEKMVPIAGAVSAAVKYLKTMVNMCLCGCCMLCMVWNATPGGMAAVGFLTYRLMLSMQSCCSPTGTDPHTLSSPPAPLPTKSFQMPQVLHMPGKEPKNMHCLGTRPL